MTVASTKFDCSDIVYRRFAASELYARIYRPVGSGPFPAVIEVHGGGWTTGDRLQNKAISESLAANGVVVMSIDFRMPPRASFPASIRDINYAIRWMKTSAEGYGSHPHLVGAVGTSSGAHQLLLCAMQPSHKAYTSISWSGNVDASLAYLVACWPVANPLETYKAAQEERDKSRIASYLAYWRTTEMMRQGSPYLVLRRGEATAFPPTLIIQGTGDERVPESMADQFVDLYRQQGGEIEIEKFPGEPHTFINKNPESAASKRALEVIAKFIQAQASSGRQST